MTPAAQNFLISLQDKIGVNELIAIQGRLEKIPDDKIPNLALVELKNPVIGLILGLLFGGFDVDRFYKGDIGLGILKFLSLFILIGVIWVIADLFLVYKGIQKDNFMKLNMVLSGYWNIDKKEEKYK